MQKAFTAPLMINCNELFNNNYNDYNPSHLVSWKTLEPENYVSIIKSKALKSRS